MGLKRVTVDRVSTYHTSSGNVRHDHVLFPGSEALVPEEAIDMLRGSGVAVNTLGDSESSTGVSLAKRPLTTEWQQYDSVLGAVEVELVGTKNWLWSTEQDPHEASRAVGAFIREVIYSSPRPLNTAGALIWFKGTENGELYEKITY